MSDVSESLRMLTKNERCEQIAQVAHQKMSDNEWIAQVTLHKWAVNEQIARFFSESLIRSLFANFFAKNKRFAKKTDEQIPNPD